MNQLDKKSKAVAFWDKAMFFSFCLLIYFLPISIALAESFAGLVLFCFLLKQCFQLKSGVNHPKLTMSVRLKEVFKPSFSNINFFIILWGAINLFSSFISIDGAVSIKAFFTKTLEVICIFYLFTDSVNTKKRIKIIVSVFAVSLFLVCLAGLYQYVYGFDFIRHKELFDMRVRSTFQAPTDFASYIVMIAPMFFCISMFLNKKQDTFQEDGRTNILLNKPVKVILFFVFAIALILLGFSYSRAGWVIMSFVLMIIALFRKKAIIPTAVFILLFAVIFVPKLISERAQMDKSSIFSSYGRTGFWSQTFIIVKDNPLFGTGLGTFTQAAKKYELGSDYYPHNSYLHMASEIGVFGVGAFVGILYLFLSQGFASLRKIDDSWMQMLLLGALAGLLGFLMHSFFDTFFYSVQLSLLMWIMMALVVVIQKVNLQES